MAEDSDSHTTDHGKGTEHWEATEHGETTEHFDITEDVDNTDEKKEEKAHETKNSKRPSRISLKSLRYRHIKTFFFTFPFFL